MREVTGVTKEGHFVGGNYREHTLKGETWYYDLGRGKLIRILTFVGPRLREIEIGKHGR